MDAYRVADAAALPAESVAEIYDRLTTDGWVLVETPEGHDLDAALLGLQTLFGAVVFHPFSREEGVVVVDNAYRPPRAMSPHTDGTYYPEPPAVMCLQCEVAAESGGATTLVDGAKLYELLAADYPADLPHLFDPVLGVRRDDRFIESPVFWRTGDGRTHIRFRIDETIKLTVAPQAQRVFEMIGEYIEAPENQLMFSLKPRQTIVVDNTRMLHGRTAYDGREARKMNRMHLNGRPASGTLQLGFVPRESAVFA